LCTDGAIEPSLTTENSDHAFSRRTPVLDPLHAMTTTKLSRWQIAALIFDLYAGRQDAIVADDASTATVVEHLLNGGREKQPTIRERLRSARLATRRLLHFPTRRIDT
jgi:hypothetical protein